MDDLIRREDVLPYLEEHCSAELYPSEQEEARKAIEMIPTVDAEPVRHAE